jgi:hypothetical protein
MDQMTHRPHAATDDHNRNYLVTGGPRFEAIDVMGLVAATIMALGPLTAYTLGF